ncbi:hypothetical protein GLW04_02280 [Halobacillus litoralis]|uniref:Uncharacterized protein n=1 Tax=Halobacillus litoralis TaxID=45668 RepID=A0A845DXA8_9BACI|nr:MULTISPECIES: hypothetical protein [Halobacillus]MYL18697.1 hypothetical protein [Halobacillus litoralis]MYL31559.1 hypothetical protein [Halobacillus halophilus]
MRKIATIKPSKDTIRELNAIITISDSYILRGITPSIDETWGSADTLFSWQEPLSSLNYSMARHRNVTGFST